MQHVVPIRRERVLPAVPAETAEDGPVDGRMLHRRPRADEWLGCGWSPLPVSGRPRVPFPDDPAMRVYPETVYRWITRNLR